METDKNFKKDMLAIAKQQDEKIGKLTNLVNENIKTTNNLVNVIKQGKQVEQQEGVYLVFANSINPTVKEELKK